MLAMGPRVLNSAPPMLFSMDHARFCRWVVFRGVSGINNLIIGAVRALCACCAKMPPWGTSPELTSICTPWLCRNLYLAISLPKQLLALWVLAYLIKKKNLPYEPLKDSVAHVGSALHGLRFVFRTAESMPVMQVGHFSAC